MKKFTKKLALTLGIMLMAGLTVTAQDPCEPTNQTAENITAHSADLSWENLDGLTWVRYYPTGTQEYKYRFAHQNNAVNLHWLQAETDYTWEINTFCDTAWTGYNWPQTFTTLEDTIVCEPTNQVAENITAHSADLSWEGLTGPTWVRYYPTGTQEYKYRFAHQNNAVSLHWLQAETEYTWELNTFCSGQWTGYDWPETFTTLEDTIVCEPTNQIAENITAHSADLSWEGLTGPTWVRYYPTGTQEYKYRFAHQNNAVSLHWLQAETEYTWELNTFCGGQWTGYDWPVTFTTLEDTIVCEPTNQIAENITAHSADLSWEGLTGPTWVRYYPTGTQEYKYRFAHQNNAVSLQWLQAETEYTWELNTLCNGMWTGYDWPQTFTTLEDTSTVNCEPTNLQAANITATSAVLSWEGIQGPTYIRYYVEGTQDYSYQFTTELSVMLENLEPETNYEWQINNFCQGSWTGYDATGYFTTLPEGSEIAKMHNGSQAFKIGVNENPEISDLSLYPNPVSDQAVLTFDATNTGKYSLQVVNILGNVTFEKENTFSEGPNTMTLDFSNHEKGIYFILLRQGDQVEKMKIVKR